MSGPNSSAYSKVDGRPEALGQALLARTMAAAFQVFVEAQPAGDGIPTTSTEQVTDEISARSGRRRSGPAPHGGPARAAVRAQARGGRGVGRREEVRDGGAEGRDTLEVERVVDPAPAPALAEEPGRAQGPQVVRDEGGTQPEHLSDVADAVLPVAQQGHDPRAVRLRHGLEADEDVGCERGDRVASVRVHRRYSNRC